MIDTTATVVTTTATTTTTTATNATVATINTTATTAATGTAGTATTTITTTQVLHGKEVIHAAIFVISMDTTTISINLLAGIYGVKEAKGVKGGKGCQGGQGGQGGQVIAVCWWIPMEEVLKHTTKSMDAVHMHVYILAALLKYYTL